jgi:hypothetical protein
MVRIKEYLENLMQKNFLQLLAHNDRSDPESACTLYKQPLA